MMKKFLLALLLLSVTQVFPQKQQNKWFFGANAAMDFNGGSPVNLAGSVMNTWEGSASIANKTTGALLFYTNGITVWTASHTVMPNGTGLLGGSSSTQAALIIPKPGSTTRYYIFTSADSGSPNGLRYSEVDMTLNAGLGDVIVATKNTALVTPIEEKLAGVMHANCTTYWIVTHGRANNSFHAYPITAAGVGGIVTSNVGTTHTIGNEIGALKLNAPGNKIAVSNYQPLCEICDFNNATGVVSNCYTLPVTNWIYGHTFSPDGTKFYANNYSNFCEQYNVSLATPAAVIASKVNVNVATGLSMGSAQVAPDGKIYIARSSSTTLAVINNPNVAGMGANFVASGYTLSTTSSLGIPNMIDGELLNCPLPTNFLNLTAQSTERGTILQWGTDFEYNSDYFEVQKSIDGVNFLPLTRVNAQGSSEVRQEYVYPDNEASTVKTTFYRIQQINRDGKTGYSNIASLTLSQIEEQKLEIRSNPILKGDKILAMYHAKTSKDFTVRVLDQLGRILYQEQKTGFMGVHNLDIPTYNFNVGVYFIQIDDKNLSRVVVVE